MAETPAATEARSRSVHQSLQYWCYSCDKRVAIETLTDLPDVVCFECKNGFVESIPAADDSNFVVQVIEALRLAVQEAREEDAPPPLPSDPSNDDYLQIELDEWVNDEEEEEEEEEEEDDNEDEHSVREEEEEEEEVEEGENQAENSRSDEEEDAEVTEPRGEDEEEEIRWRDVIRGRRMRLLLASRRRNRILDWADVLMGIENHSIELTLQVPDSDTYVGNPGDYVDASEYEALLQNLAETDNGARRGAPPAAKAAVEGLESVEIGKEEDTVVCAICKDLVNVGEIAKNLPCGHGYHGECIVPWLGSRNTCPVCRFELPTDDPEYEEERKKRVVVAGLRGASTGASASAPASVGDGDSPDHALE